MKGQCLPGSLSLVIHRGKTVKIKFPSADSHVPSPKTHSHTHQLSRYKEQHIQQRLSSSLKYMSRHNLTEERLKRKPVILLGERGEREGEIRSV